MTATAQSSADELSEFYGLNVAVIPPHTASIRVDYPDVVFAHREAKRQAIVNEIRKTHALGRPILVGTASVKESEELVGDLHLAGIKCTVLNAKNDELEAEVIAKAGMFGAVTISTNMAGRGVDIKLGGDDEKQRDAVSAVGRVGSMSSGRIATKASALITSSEAAPAGREIRAQRAFSSAWRMICSSATA